MVLLPCSDCCGCDCPNAPGACFQVTLAGFGGSADACGECSYLDGTYVLKRHPINNPTATATITAATGSGAVLAVTLTRSEAQGYYAITAVDVTNGGSGYPEEVAVNHTLSGLVVDCDGDPQLEATVEDGEVVAVSIVKAGRFYPSPLCEWFWLGCPACPDNQTGHSTSHAGLEVRFILGETSAAIRVTLGQVSTNYYTGVRSFDPGTVIYEAETAVAEGWESLTFETADASVTCETTGTATVEPGSCLAEDGCGECCLPDSISLSTSGWGAAIGWTSQNGGAPGMSTCGEDGPAGGWGNVFCGECGEGTPEDGCRVRFVGSASGPASYSVFQLGSNKTGILDRVHPATYQPWKPGDPCAPIMYLGPMPSMPMAGGTPTVNVDCGGYPSSASVTLSHIDLTSSVAISPPTKDPAGTQATAEISAITSGGITSVSLTDGGSGYAVEIMERVLPEVAVSVTTTSGAGATIEATLLETTDYNGDKVWTVDSISITSGGTGYGPDDSIEIAPAAGSLGYSTYASITIDRAEPAAFSASAPGGSGAVLVPVLTKSTDYFGQDYWSVASVTVTSGGSGYTDGDPVTFSGSFERFAASATAVVTGGEITSVSVTYGGEYFDTDGIIQSASLGYYGGGEFYKLEGTGVVDADTPDVLFNSASGSGATATAEVDDNLTSPTFGKILSVTVTAAGENYYLGGKGWKAQIDGVYGMIHRDQCLIESSSWGPCDDPDEAEAFGCSSMLAEIQHISARVSASVCPTDLLSRTYAMAYKATIYPGGFENACGAASCLSGPSNNVLTVTSWGEDDALEIELAGAS